MNYEYSDLEIRAILGAAEITYNPNFLNFLTQKIRRQQLLDQSEEIISYLKRLANIRIFYPQALKVLEEIVLQDCKKFTVYMNILETIAGKYPDTKTRENLSKRSLNFVQTLASKRKYQSEIIAGMEICTHFSRQWQIEVLQILGKYCPKDALSFREIFKNKLRQTALTCQTSEELDILSGIAKSIHVYIPEL